jgi:class 3 adenylate cyclase
VEAVALWSIEHDPEPALRIVAYWGQRLFAIAPARVSSWVLAAAQVEADVPPALRSRALRIAGSCMATLRDFEIAERLLNDAADAATEARANDLHALALALLGSVYGHTQRRDEAIPTLDRALAEAREAATEAELASVLNNVGSAAVGLGEVERGQAALEESIALAERLGRVATLFTAQNNLGTILLNSDPDRSAEVFLAALSLSEAEIPSRRVMVQDGLACSMLLTGDVADAQRQYLENAELARQVGRGGTLHATLQGLMGVASAQGKHDVAARIAGAAAAYKPRATLPSYLQRFETASREALADRWDMHFAEGSRLSVADALDLLRDEPEGAAVVRRTFMFTDIVSSTTLLAAIGDAAWQSLVSWHDRTLRAQFAAHRGEEVDHAGDGFFVAFPTAREAVECATAVQRVLAAHRRQAGFAPDVRIGLHDAEASHAQGGFRGIGVHTAARIGAAAGAGEIVASEATATAGHAAIEGAAAEVELKGLPAPVRLVRLAWRESG